MLDSGRTYERAFESLLRARRTPFISLTDARRSLAPGAAALRIRRASAAAKTSDLQIDRCNFYRLAASCGHRVNISFWQLVVWLIVAVRCEINLRTVVRPCGAAFIEPAFGELSRLHFFFSTARRVDEPNV